MFLFLASSIPIAVCFLFRASRLLSQPPELARRCASGRRASPAAALLFPGLLPHLSPHDRASQPHPSSLLCAAPSPRPTTELPGRRNSTSSPAPPRFFLSPTSSQPRRLLLFLPQHNSPRILLLPPPRTRPTLASPLPPPTHCTVLLQHCSPRVSARLARGFQHLLPPRRTRVAMSRWVAPPSFHGVGMPLNDARDLVIKVKYGGTLQQFNARVKGSHFDLNLAALRSKISNAFKFSPSDVFVLTYIDEDGDVVMLDANNDFRDAAIRQKLNPLRIDVQWNSSSAFSITSGAIQKTTFPAVREPTHSLRHLRSLHVLLLQPARLLHLPLELRLHLFLSTLLSNPGAHNVFDELSTRRGAASPGARARFFPTP